MKESLNILIVEDSHDDAELAVRQLRQSGFVFRWHRVSSEAEYLKRLDGSLDAILADYALPRFSAPRALQLLNESGLDVPFIVVTGAVSEEAAVECMRNGAADYLLKDRLTRLGPAVRQAIAQRHLRAQKRQAEEQRERLLESEHAARSEAEAANRAKDQFLSIISHELRTPLTPILGWVQLLESKNEPELVSEGLQIIAHNTRSLLRLVNDLLDASRLATGKFRVDLHCCRLVPSIRSALVTLQGAAGAKQIEVAADLDDDGHLMGDADRLEQIAWNLLSNAIKFTPPGGRICLRLRCDADRLHFSVTDSGEGIKPEFLPYIFDHFEQADSSNTRAHGGLGLGLAIVRHLVEMHGGTIDVESPGTGCGATFTVHLPLLLLQPDAAHQQTDPPALHAEAEGQSRLLAGLHILLTETESQTRDCVGLILQQHGAQVSTAISPGGALAVLQGSAAWPHLVLCSLANPDLEGRELLENIRAMCVRRHTRLPVVALTGRLHDTEREQIMAAGFQALLPKPVQPDQLLATILHLTQHQPEELRHEELHHSVG